MKTFSTLILSIFLTACGGSDGYIEPPHAPEEKLPTLIPKIPCASHTCSGGG